MLSLKDIIALHDEEKLIGIFDVDHEAYHKGPGISSSDLKAIVNNSEAHFKYWRENPREETNEMLEGTLLHEALLMPDVFKGKYTTLDLRTKEGKQAIENGKIKISSDQQEKAIKMAGSVERTQTYKMLVKNALFEKAIYWRDPETDILCKCKPDIISLSMQCLVDPKTTNDCSEWGIQGSIRKFHYYMQTAFHLKGLQTIYPEITDTLNVFIEKQAPHGVRFVSIAEKNLAKGRLKVKEALFRYKRAMETGEFPGYSEDIITIDAFKWEAV